MSTAAMPTELKTVRVLLFVISGIGLSLFAVAIVRTADQATLLIAYVAYVLQAVLTLILGFLLAPGRAWLIYAVPAYAAVAMLATLTTILGGDFGALTQLILPALICYLTLRPGSRAYLRG
ncbi:hypothetical protein ACFOVU_20910 [Nocardiopsis sediminis]|uniref:Uncharacterized protein n=1 Tax=Nocardiopsis sediminis TaxID=1778267 RepID=A0ABV8FSM8_9ACTN